MWCFFVQGCLNWPLLTPGPLYVQGTQSSYLFMYYFYQVKLLTVFLFLIDVSLIYNVVLITAAATAAAAKSLQLCPTLCDPIDSSPPGSPVPGILQAPPIPRSALEKDPRPGPLFEGNPVGEGTTRRGAASPVHRPQSYLSPEKPVCGSRSNS